MNDWSEYTLEFKFHPYHTCRACHWVMDISCSRCVKCGITTTTTNPTLPHRTNEELAEFFMSQEAWIERNNPSEEEKEKALDFAKRLWSINLL